MRLHNLKTFLALAQNDCNFSIHTVLGISRSTMWSHISDLESEVGFKLVNRKKQNTSFTEDGLLFIPYAKNIYETFENSIAKMRSNRGKDIPGEIIISTTKAAADSWLLPGMKKFSEQYPEINITIVAEDHLSKKLANSADIFLRPIANIDNVQRKWFISYTNGLFASQKYLDKMGIPKAAEDLLKHRIISYGEQEFSYFDEINWHIKGRGYGLPKLAPTLSINSTIGIFSASSEGLGICSAVVEASAYYNKYLMRVLPDIVGPVIKSYFCIREILSDQKQHNISLFQSYVENYLKQKKVTIHYE